MSNDISWPPTIAQRTLQAGLLADAMTSLAIDNVTCYYVMMI